MDTLTDRIKTELNRAFWRLSMETSTAARSGIIIIRAMADLHVNAADQGFKADVCMACGDDWPCRSILIIADELKVKQAVYEIDAEPI